jgi:hypothetical protein
MKSIKSLIRWLSVPVALLAALPTVSAQEDQGKVPPPAPVPPMPVDPTAKPKPKDVGTKSKSIIDALAKKGHAQKQNPSDEPRSAPQELAQDASQEAQNVAERQRQGLLAFQQAKAAYDAKRPVEALNLVRKAKQLFPGNQEISEFAAKLQKEVGANRMVASTNTKAKAYLAAGYARGHDLFLAGRFAEAEDLLSGVVEACKLFSDPSQVEFYKKLAESDLGKYQAGIASGVIIPPTTSASSGEISAAVIANEPPRNARRLLTDSESRAPVWYVQQKNLLAVSMTVDYRRVPAAFVFDDISSRTNVSIVIDRPVALARSHVNALIDLRVGDMPAETILDLVCRKAGLEYVMMEKSIVITTRSKAIEYVRQLPESLRQNWALGRILFPEMNPELFASVEGSGPALSPQRVRDLDANVPSHLQSGKALIAAIQALLR